MIRLVVLMSLFGDPTEGRKTAPPTAPHVVFRIGGEERGGWPLDPEADGGYALLWDEGEIAVLPADPSRQPLRTEAVAVTAIPSDALASGLGHAEEGVRDRCGELLREQGSLGIPALLRVLDADSADARRRALLVLVETGGRKQQAKFRSCISDRDEKVRQAALRAYAATTPRDLFEVALHSYESDRALIVRHEAIVLLGRTGDLRAVEPLLAGMDETMDRSLRLVTFDALRRITGMSFGRDEEAWRTWWSNHGEEVLHPEEKEEESAA